MTDLDYNGVLYQPDVTEQGVTCCLASFLMQYWNGNFDGAESWLVNLKDRMYYPSLWEYLPERYDLYSIDGFMFSITDCLLAACNEGDFYVPTSDEYKRNATLLGKYLRQGHTEEPETDPRKGLVDDNVSNSAYNAACALRYYSLARHHDQSWTVRTSKYDWQDFYKYCCELDSVRDLKSNKEKIKRLGYILAEAAATKYSISVGV